jgi:SAM-dependent methyltransferase
MNDWAEYAKNAGLRAVIDPADTIGYKNRYINLLHHKVLADAIGDRLQGRSVLDLGCGNGRFYEFLKSCGTLRIMGVDSCYEMIKAYPGPALHAASTYLPFPRNNFDAVLSVWTLQYLNPVQLWTSLSEISRILKPEGTVFLIEQVSREGYGDVYWRSPAFYKNMFCDQGFEMTSCRPIMYDSDKLVGIIRHGLVPEFLFGILSDWHLSMSRDEDAIVPAEGYLDVFMEFKKVK